MDSVERMSAFSEFINSPVLTIICAFLLLLLGALACWFILSTGARERDVKIAEAETQKVIREARAYFRSLDQKCKDLGVEKFVMSMEIKELQRENDRLNYRIQQLVKGADYDVQHERSE